MRACYGHPARLPQDMRKCVSGKGDGNARGMPCADVSWVHMELWFFVWSDQAFPPFPIELVSGRYMGVAELQPCFFLATVFDHLSERLMCLPP